MEDSSKDAQQAANGPVSPLQAMVVPCRTAPSRNSDRRLKAVDKKKHQNVSQLSNRRV